MMLRLFLLVLLTFATGTITAGENAAPAGIERLQELGFRILQPQERSRMVGGVLFGPDYRWCKITPESYVARTEPGMLKHLLEDKSINSLDLHPGPWPFQDVPDESIDLDDAILEDLAVLTHLRQLRATNLDFSTAERIALLRPLNELTRLELNMCDVTLKDLATLGPWDNLVSVWIDNGWGNKLSAENAQRISRDDIAELAKQFPNLERLYYKSHDKFSPGAFAAFSDFTELKFLRIDSSSREPRDYTPEHREAFSRTFAPLREQHPNLDIGVNVQTLNWEELSLRPPIKEEDDD